MKLLIIEDHPALRELLRGHLEHRGFVVDVAASGEAGLLALRLARYDALLLDLGLPDCDGTQVLAACAPWRADGMACLVLTARDALASRVASLDAGADDYILKPFDMPELEARLRAVLRRSGRQRERVLRLGSLEFEPETQRLALGTHELVLARREALLLEALLRVSPRIVIKDTLEDQLYGAHESVTPNAVEALVSRLRRKLAALGADVRIDTVRGVGYRLLSDETPADQTPDNGQMA